MAFSKAYESELEIIEENDPYFIGRTSQWDDRPNDQVVLGYNAEYNKQIIPVDYYKMLGDPEEYGEQDTNCRKHICVGRGVLKSHGNDDLYSLNWCSGCHESAKKGWMKLMKSNSGIGVSQFI